MDRKLDGTSAGAGRIPTRVCSAAKKPNSSEAATAPFGLHRPKMTAASAMNPLPADMFSVNGPMVPMDRYAPASPAMPPATTTLT
jgi:hypothetical protein